MDEQPVHETWLHSDRVIPTRFVRPLLRFTHVEAAGGIVLLVAAVAAIIWSNLPDALGESYETLWETHIDLVIGPVHFEETLREFVNDGLMAVFFLVVGMEIKRELVIGDLRDPRRAALPAIGALGGMVVPAVLYLLIAGGGEAARGWGIPMATDIAFSVGVVALLGTRVPVGAKLFLLALAIVDDIGAIAVIAVFYTDDLSLGWLALAIIGVVIIAIATRVRIRYVPFFIGMGFLTWLCLLESGVHATLAGVAIGLLTPARPLYSDEDYRMRARWIIGRFEMDSRDPRALERVDDEAMMLAAVARESVAPLTRQEHAIHPWSSFIIVPIFALANARIRFTELEGSVADSVTSSVAIAVAVGLLVGKFAGISAFTWLAVKTGLGKLPKHTGWAHVLGVASLAGIGFTVSLFITGLAFDDQLITDQAKIGIYFGSAAAGVLGILILRRLKPVGTTDPEALDHATAEVSR